LLIHNKTLAEKLLSIPISKSGWRGLTFMAGLFLSGDYLKQRGSLVATFARTAQTLTHYGDIHDFTSAVNRIDDILDSSFGEDILAAGKAEQAPDFCEFLKNPDICPASYFTCLDRLVDLGLTDKQTAIAFSNLFAVMMQTRAVHEIRARHNDAPESRLEMSRLTLGVTEAYTIFVYRCFNHFNHNYNDLPNFDHRQATSPYPDVTRLARLGQIIDDIRDLIPDMQSEIETGIATPNWLAAQLASRDQLTDKKGVLLPRIREFIDENKDRAEPVSIGEWPLPVYGCVESAENYFQREIKKIRGVASRCIITNYFYISVNEGLKSATHPDIVAKASMEKAEQQQLAARYG
jgi:hypothetical protein